MSIDRYIFTDMKCDPLVASDEQMNLKYCNIRDYTRCTHHFCPKIEIDKHTLLRTNAFSNFSLSHGSEKNTTGTIFLQTHYA